MCIRYEPDCDGGGAMLVWASCCILTNARFAVFLTQYAKLED